MARHRSPSGVSATLSGLSALRPSAHSEPAEPSTVQPDLALETLPTGPLQLAEFREAGHGRHASEPAQPRQYMQRTMAALSGRLAAGSRSRHRPAYRNAHRRPLAAVAATLVAASIFAGSQPVSMAASPQALVAASAGDQAAAVAERGADAAASRGERTEGDSILAAPPPLPGAEPALVPELGSSGGANGPTGSAALTGNPCPTEGFGGVKPHVAQAGWHLSIVFGIPESRIGGVASRPGNSSSDHPRGYALDFMVDNATGDALAAYAEEHTEELAVKYILWQVPDHYDHVHISFNDNPGSGMTC